MTTALQDTSLKVGLRINVNKTKILQIGKQQDGNIITDQHPVEEVEHFMYLGSIISNSGDTEKDVNCRIGKASSVFQKMNDVWTTTAINIKLKLQLYNSLIVPIVTYASETWKITARIAKTVKCIPSTVLEEDPWCQL